MSKEINITHSGGNLLIEERTGKLPDLPPVPVQRGICQSGILTSVFAFLSFRQSIIDLKQAIVTVDRKKLEIRAETNPTYPEISDTITGTIEINPDLKNFKINQVGSQFSRETLMGFLRTNRQYFPDKEAHGQLMSTIRNLQVKVNIQSGRQEDNRGNRNNSLDKSVDVDNIPVSTIIEIPVFIGERPVRIQLDICYDTSEQNIFFWFESAELNEIIYDGANGRMDKEIAAIRDLGFLVLEK